MATAASSSPLPTPSAVTTLLANSTSPSTPTPTSALPLEILHNLRHQHHWTDLLLLSHPSPGGPNSHTTSIPPLSLSPSQTKIPTLITGIPPRPVYIHPSYQAHLLKHLPPPTITPTSTLSPHSPSPQPERETVLPLTLGQPFTLALLSAIFDTLPPRAPIVSEGDGFKFEHQDAKRMLLAMKGGAGGDGTVVYYIVQEGDVKPRQN